MTDFFQPHFKRYGFPIEIPMSPKGLLSYLSWEDPNLKEQNLKETIDFAASFNPNPDQVKLLNKVGQGLIFDGMFDDTLISEGQNALNRRGFFKIVGPLEQVTEEYQPGKSITWIKAPTIYCEGPGKTVYINIMNVSPLINRYGFGFDLRNSNNLVSYNGSTRDKLEFLQTLSNQVIYISQQYWQPTDDYNLKCTIWLRLPISIDRYHQLADNYFIGGEYIVFNKLPPHTDRY